ncbi:conserved hypothetical protein [Neospora caninum Liverpool]|uniref:Inositol phospholipid synthesis Scs3p domain-containing protein n=1 Tax=Neospora caninum (strain Liverpool) TaxID=572307 RepID=F0VNB8_NEOCL|nr:conserved hypothetical protein [Neospora caninum Liverpool]CBZ55214.1 conserved hypothetical protein [Neospora caninum Liverpool]CEL69941.1 TPA: Inositol phospholipid synthesis Scs3p domain-containing protein [Neospora caninum Liverpool]|eukprot:XP_003885242.1 conserved hypothetical protein [Neospora caninum Liverpool]
MIDASHQPLSPIRGRRPSTEASDQPTADSVSSPPSLPSAVDAAGGASGGPRSRYSFARSSISRASISSASSASSGLSLPASSQRASRRSFRRDRGIESSGVSSAMRAYTPQVHTFHEDLQEPPGSASGEVSPGTPSPGAGTRRSRMATPAACSAFSSSVLSSSSEDSISSLASSPNPSSLTSPTPLEDNGPEDEGLDGEDAFRDYAGREDCSSVPLTPSLGVDRFLSSGTCAFLRSRSSSSLTRGEPEGTPRMPYLDLCTSVQPALDSAPASRGYRRQHRSVSPASSLSTERPTSAAIRHAHRTAGTPFAAPRRAGPSVHFPSGLSSFNHRGGAAGVFAFSAATEGEGSEAVSSSGDESVVRGRGQVSFCSSPHSYEDDVTRASCRVADLSGRMQRPRHNAAFLVDPVVSASVCSHLYPRRTREGGPEIRHANGSASKAGNQLYIEGARELTPPRSLSPPAAADASRRAEGPGSRSHVSPGFVDLPSPSSLLLHLDEATTGTAVGEERRGGWRKFLASLAAMRARKWSSSDGKGMAPGAVTTTLGEDEDDPDPVTPSTASPPPPSLKGRVREMAAATRRASSACIRPGRLSGRCYFYMHLLSLLLLLCLVLLAGTLHHDQKIHRLRPKQVAELQLHTSQRLWAACARASSASASPLGPAAFLESSAVVASDVSLESGGARALEAAQAWHERISAPSFLRICRHVGRGWLPSGRARGEESSDGAAAAVTSNEGDPGKDLGLSAESVTAGKILSCFLRPCEGTGSSPSPSCMHWPSASSLEAGARFPTCRASPAWRGLDDLAQLCLPLVELQADVPAKTASAALGPASGDARADAQAGCDTWRSTMLQQSGLSETCAAASSAGVCQANSASRATTAALSNENAAPATPGSSADPASPSGSGLALPAFSFPRSVSFFFFHREGLPASFLDPERHVLACTEVDSPFLHLFSSLRTSDAYRMFSASFVSLLSSVSTVFSPHEGDDRTHEGAPPAGDKSKQTGELVARKSHDETSAGPFTLETRARACKQIFRGAACSASLADFELGVVSLLAASCQQSCRDRASRLGCLDEDLAADAKRQRAGAYASTLRAAFGNLLPQFFLLSYESALAAQEATETASASQGAAAAGQGPPSQGTESPPPHLSPVLPVDRHAVASDAYAPLPSFLPQSSLLFDFAVFATPCYPFSRFLHRRLVSWGGLQFHILLFGGWIHSLFAPEPLTLLHVPRAFFLVLVSAYRGLVLYEGLNWIEKAVWARNTHCGRPEERNPSEASTPTTDKETSGDGAQQEPSPDNRGTATRSQATEEDGERTRPDTSSTEDGASSGDKTNSEGGWWARKDLSDHVVLYVMAIVFMSIEVSAARSSHAPPSFSEVPTPTTGADASRRRARWFTCLPPCLLPRKISSFLYILVFAYYGILFLCCLHMAYYTAVFFHTPEEIWAGLTVGLCFLVLPIILVLEVLEKPSLQRIGIGSGEKKAAERAAAAAAAASASAAGAQNQAGGDEPAGGASPRVGKTRRGSRTVATDEHAGSATEAGAAVSGGVEGSSRESNKASAVRLAERGVAHAENRDGECQSAEETARRGVRDGGCARGTHAL